MKINFGVENTWNKFLSWDVKHCILIPTIDIAVFDDDYNKLESLGIGFQWLIWKAVILFDKSPYA